MPVYILQLKEPLGSERHQAQYYIGFCKGADADARLADHRVNKGAAFTKAANARNIRYDIVCIMEGDRSTERQLKNVKNTLRILKQIKAGTFSAAEVRYFGWTG